MGTRAAKTLLLAGIALYYLLIVFNNLTDFDSNYEVVRHVLSMDTTFPGNHGMSRAIHSQAVYLAFYLGIVAWEIATAALLCWGTVRLARAPRQSVDAFNRAKRTAIAGLTLSLLMWLVAFLAVGGEWFLMWQSAAWNGQNAAFRMFVVVGLVLAILMQPDADGQP
jgi:predicted small integral membrane protein